jgi:hypothetical protein
MAHHWRMPGRTGPDQRERETLTADAMARPNSTSRLLKFRFSELHLASEAA